MKGTSPGVVSPPLSFSSEHKDKFAEEKFERGKRSKREKKGRELSGKGSTMTFGPEKKKIIEKPVMKI